MKSFLVFCVAVVTIGLVSLALPFVKDRERQYEERLVGALNFAEEKIESTLDLRTGLYKPLIAPGPGRDQWVISGIMVTHDNLSGRTSAPFSAVLENICPDPAEPSCWRMIDLAVDGRKIDSARLTGAAPASVAQGEGHADPGESIGRGETTAPSSAQETAETPELTPGKPIDASAALTAKAVEAGASPVPATAASTQAIAAPDVVAGGSSQTPADIELSKQDLTRFIQDGLKQLNYKPGPTDGKLGPQTAAAIKAYQRDFHLVPDGRPSIGLLLHLRGNLSDLGQQSREPSRDGGQPLG